VTGFGAPGVAATTPGVQQHPSPHVPHVRRATDLAKLIHHKLEVHSQRSQDQQRRRRDHAVAAVRQMAHREYMQEYHHEATRDTRRRNSEVRRGNERRGFQGDTRPASAMEYRRRRQQRRSAETGSRRRGHGQRHASKLDTVGILTSQVYVCA